MDFFAGLDNARYSEVKTEIIDNITAGAMEHPGDMNQIYLLAAQWLKVPRSNTGKLASTFTTRLDGIGKMTTGREKKVQETSRKA
jgi:hypothetical protein